MTTIFWDHAASEVKVCSGTADNESYCILGLQNSVEFEGELKLRFANRRAPSTMYIGMFAGATKPKPFQRKRPNVSHLATGKLPPLHDMRNMALKLHSGSYCPCPNGESRRIELAFQHIMTGFNTFPISTVRDKTGLLDSWARDAILEVHDEKLVFRSNNAGGPIVEYQFEDISEWVVEDNEHVRDNSSGIEIRSSNGASVYFGVPFVRDLKHTLEYFWNTYRISVGEAVLPGSTHGRPLVSITTLSGEIPAPETIVGSCEVVDQEGIVVRPGGRINRRSSLSEAAVAAVAGKSDPKVVPPENYAVKKHWHKVVLHQGWLCKKGGLGVKSWIKRYVVLYKTSQGHFLTYYSDFTDCPMYSTEKTERNVIDLAKTTFVRPGSNKIDQPDTPPHAFDIVTTEREWTLAADSQEAELKWLKILTRAIDEDVAILPDEDLIFKVKPKSDPSSMLNSSDYSTTLKVSANGVAVCAPDNVTGLEKQIFFWVYTDFYKWSLLSQQGKLALLVNVFADAAFTRRNEYIFRTKEALRLSTAIEFFIEKFMSVMHVRLEAGMEAASGGNDDLKQANADEFGHDDVARTAQELNLLDMDEPVSPAGSSDPFGADPFGAPKPSAPATTVDPFGADPFGAPAPQAAAADPFGSDPFGAPAAPAAKTAPPLTEAQSSQHKAWRNAAMMNNGGPIYDDGTVQIASKLEVRGAQCRLSLFYRNQSSAGATNFNLSISDSAGLTTFEPVKVTSDSVAAGGGGQLQVILECVKPTHPGPELVIQYTDGALGIRSSTVTLPICVTTFNEPIVMNGQDFIGRWNQLGGKNNGQDVQEVLKPSTPIVPANIAKIFTSVSL